MAELLGSKAGGIDLVEGPDVVTRTVGTTGVARNSVRAANCSTRVSFSSAATMAMAPVPKLVVPRRPIGTRVNQFP